MVSDPARFAQDWLAAWNAHDVEAVLAHFADDVLFTSPVARRVLPDSDGRLSGKQAVRDYWNYALTRISDLHFELVDVYAGTDTLVLHYRNQLGGLVNEVLTFDGELVVTGHGTYLL